MGAGRTELGRALFGVLPVGKGEILFHGRPVKIKSPTSAIELGICYLTEDRKEDGLFLDKSASFNLTISQLDRIIKFGLIDTGAQTVSSAMGIPIYLGNVVEATLLLVTLAMFILPNYRIRIAAPRPQKEERV